MTDAEFELIVYEAVEQLKARSPIKTGNLRYNAIKVRKIADGTWKIYVDEAIAPYMVYTNEPWVKRPGKNPNEGWFDRAVEIIMNTVQARTGAESKR